MVLHLLFRDGSTQELEVSDKYKCVFDWRYVSLFRMNARIMYNELIGELMGKIGRCDNVLCVFYSGIELFTDVRKFLDGEKIL